MIDPDGVILWEIGGWAINQTIASTWLVMTLLVVGSWLITRRLTVEGPRSRWQTALEAIVEALQNEIRDASQQEPAPFLPFLGTLFLFIAASNSLGIVPRFTPPTASLSTTAALAALVFVAVPMWGIRRKGLLAYLRNYIQPSFILLPLNIVGEISRTVALAMRLWGNAMSGAMIGAVLLSLAPFFLPTPMMALALLSGVIQAYIFTILATVFIGSAVEVERRHDADEGDSHG